MAPKQSNEKSLKKTAEDNLKSNPSALGDPISLKAESANSEPTEHDRGAMKTMGKGHKKDEKSLTQAAKETNPTLLGDPISMKAEKSDSEPTDDDRGALKGSGGNRRQSKM